MDPPLPLMVKAEDDYHDVDEPSAIGISMISSEEGSANKTNDVVELDGPALMTTAAPTSMLPQATGPSAASMPTSSDATTSEEIKITEQDVLFGRGGLTNHHIGNLRYRDVIELHRQDYINSPKTEKPNVARRIVKALRTGPNPGRFLKKDANGKWHEVNDQEAAWKASQALREKSRWASMKKDKEGSNISDLMVTSAMMQVVESATTNAVKKSAKRDATDTEKEAEEESKVNSEAKVNSAKVKKAKYEHSEPVDVVPTEASHIAVPPVASPEGKKSGTVHMQTQYIDGATYIIPQDEDVLFGRGGRTNNHPGNVRLREIVDQYRHIYAPKKIDKPNVSKLIVGALRSANPPSRFLRMNDETSRWEDVGDRRAAEKVSQTLREKDRTSPKRAEDGDDVSDIKPAANLTSEASDETTAFEVNDNADRSVTTLEVDDGADNVDKLPDPLSETSEATPADGVELPHPTSGTSEKAPEDDAAHDAEARAGGVLPSPENFSRTASI